MTAQWFIHLPAIKADGLDGYPIGPGVLKHLSFEQWYGLDQMLPSNKSNYLKSEPLFLVGEVPFIDDVEACVEQVNQIARKAYYSFLLFPSDAIIPNPQMSCIYIRLPQPEEGKIVKLIGAFEREWLVFGNVHSTNFREEHLKEVNKTYLFLNKDMRFESNNTIMSAIRTLQFTCNPEFTVRYENLSKFNGFIYSVSTIEGLVSNKNISKQYYNSITQTFGCQLAALLTNNHEQFDQYKAFLSELYRLRSKVIHGEGSEDQMTQRTKEALNYTSGIFKDTLKRVIALFNLNIEPKEVPSYLAQAAKNKNKFELLHSRLDQQLT